VDRPQIIRRPDFSPNEMNSFSLHISSSWNPSRNLLFQLHWNEFWKLGFQCSFQRTWNARFRMHFFFRTDTLSFRLQFRRVCFAIWLLGFQLHFSLSKTQFYSCTLDYDFRCN
jgi:hypothetical protein